MEQFGPTMPLSQEIHAEKYREPGESFREAMGRVAASLSDGPEHYHEFRDILLDMRFMPGGRIQAAMGTAKTVTAYNCFVSGTIADSFVHGDGCIMDMAKEAAATMRMGGGIGYDFSTLRPRGSLIKKLRSASSGPLSFMEIFDAVCRCVASSGHRRGAQMGVLRVDHPDIMEFLDAKTNSTQLTGFNISVAITDKFMQALELGRPFELQFNGETYQEVDPVAVWEKIMRTTWDWAEPGVLFIDRINEDNNLRYCETIAATNPCGEQPLPPYGACLLGSFNLTKYLRPKTVAMVGQARWDFDWEQFKRDIPFVVRAMDNVVDRTSYPLEAQKQEAKNKRRMGLGITGLANAGEALGFVYGSEAFLKFEADVLDELNRLCYTTGALLAKEKGAFPLFDERYGVGGFFDRTFKDSEVSDLVAKHGLRNSHYTSIAPTGTISLAADNISSGIEPVFSHGYDRTINMPDGVRVERVEDYGVAKLGVHGKTADKVTVREHLNALVVAARRVDSAVSKTCNVAPDTPWEDFKAIYHDAWQAGAKGCTTFNVGGKRFGILVAKDEESNVEEGSACRIDLETGRRECA